MDYLSIATLAFAAVGAVAALATALYERYNARINQQNLDLALEQERRKRPELSMHLIDGYIERVGGERTRVYAFRLSISNSSDADTSLKSVTLEVELSHGERPNSLFVLTHDASLAVAHRTQAQEGALQVPCRIAASETIEGWAVFRLDDDLLRGGTVQGCKLTVVDIHDVVWYLEPIALCERVRHEPVAQRDNRTEAQS